MTTKPKTLTLTMTCAIRPEYQPRRATGKQGSLENTTASDIKRLLGFGPNLPASLDGKVQKMWGFTVGGHYCSIWDYKGSAKDNTWSFYGPQDILTAIFGDRVAS